MTISTYFIVTEPEKMGFPYIQSIASVLPFSDEVIVVCGRKEESSEGRIRALSSKIKVINTDAWPEDWHYDDMKTHLQVGLDACTKDWALKLDVDSLFRTDQADNIKAIFEENNDRDRINFGRINFFCKDQFKINRNHVLFALNKAVIQGTITIVNDGGSHQPCYDNATRAKQVSETLLLPINYDNTFMTREQISTKWIYWFRAFNKKFKKDMPFALGEHSKALQHYISYMAKKKIGSQEWPNFHPVSMTEAIVNLDSDQWGYDNFGG